MKKVFLVIFTYDYADDGFNIEGIFSTRKKAESYIVNKDSRYKKEDEDYFYFKESYNKFSEGNYMTIYEEEIK